MKTFNWFWNYMFQTTYGYYIWYLFTHRLLWWSICTECGHRGYSHVWGHTISDGKVYCGKFQCGCGYHCGR